MAILYDADAGEDYGYNLFGYPTTTTATAPTATTATTTPTQSYDLSPIISGYESLVASSPTAQQYLSQIDTPEEYAYALSEPFSDLVNQYGNPGENLAYWAAGLVDPRSVEAYTQAMSGGTVDNLSKMLYENPYMSGVSVIRPDIPDAWLGVADPSVAENSQFQTDLYNQYGITPEDYSAAMTNWTAENSSTAQAARDTDDGFEDLLQLAALAAAIYTGGSSLGLFGAEVTASSMLAAESAALLEAGFTTADVAGSLAGLGSASEIGAILTSAGVSAAEAGVLANEAISGGLADTLGGVATQTVASEVGSINPALAESFAETYAPSAWVDPTAATTAASSDVTNLGDLWDYSAPTETPTSIYSTSPYPTTPTAPTATTATGGYVDSGITSPVTTPYTPDYGTALDAEQAVQYGAGTGTVGLDAGGYAPIDTLGSTNWLSSALNTIQAGGSLPSALTETLKAAGLLSPTGSLLAPALSILGGALNSSAIQDAAQTAANAQLDAARIAADAAKFRPVGVTTRFGSSNFTKDENGYVNGAGYTLTPDIKAMQDQLLAGANQMLPQYAASLAATAPMGDAAQRMMSLGNQYLATDPQAQAAKYLADQQALLATGRERDVANTLAGELARGTYGISTGGTSTGMMGSNPRLEALYNAQRQQDLGLAANATQGGMEYAKFGSGLVGSGGTMLRDMYSTQAASLDPWKAGMNSAQYLEGLGQNALTLGMDIGRTTTAANAASGNLLAQGMLGAAQTTQGAAGSLWGDALMSSGNALSSMTAQQQQALQQQQQQQYQNQLLASLAKPTYNSYYPAPTQSGFQDWSYNGSWY